MKPKKKWGTALVVFVATVGTSHLMQTTWSVSALNSVYPLSSAMPHTSDVVPAEAETPPDVSLPVLFAGLGNRFSGFTTGLPEFALSPDAMLASLDETPAPPRGEIPVPQIPDDVAGPAPLPSPGQSPQERLALSGSTEMNATDVPAVNEYGLRCGVIVSAAERPAAMVKLTVTAPCRSGERITVRHDGLVFSAAIGPLGSYSVEMPALQSEARFDIAFGDGTAAETELTVAAVEANERVVLQYNGETGLQIHALEYGADYGEVGHVWAGSPRDPETALTMGGGFMTALGDPNLPDPFLAEVYTLPRDVSSREGVVRLNVETEISAGNCARTIAGETLQRQPDGRMVPVALTLSMPDCEAVGEFLVLKNLLRDLKIASN